MMTASAWSGRLTTSPRSEIICGMEYVVRSMASYETRKFVDNIIRLLERKGMTREAEGGEQWLMNLRGWIKR